MPNPAIDNFNIVCATLGGFIASFGLVSYLLKETFYLSESLISTIAGIIFSPHATNLIRPLEYALGDEEVLASITLYFSRLVLGVQLVLAGVQLPSRYLKKEWKSLAILLGPGMTVMWLISSLLIWAFVPNLKFVHALAIGACITPTDPVLSATIVKGKFADKNIPRELQRIIIAESGANDGLGYPFLFLPLYLIKFSLGGGAGSTGNGGTAVAMWFYETWFYQIFLSCVYGAMVGWLAKEVLHWAESRRFVDRESFLVFAIALALFIIGTCGLIGSDDVLACFIAGNAFTWDDWFRTETEDDSLQPAIDMLLNVSIFIWFGAVCPWHMFAHNNVIPIYRLIFLSIFILLLRRLPFVAAVHTKIYQIEEWRQALFVGFFGPIGVSAIFYLYVTLKFLQTEIVVDGHERPDAKKLGEVMTVVIWFMVICSIIVHGLSVPVGKLGWYIPRTLSLALSDTSEEPLFRISGPGSAGQVFGSEERGQTGLDSPSATLSSAVPRSIYRIGGPIIRGKVDLKSPSKAATPHPRTPRPNFPDYGSFNQNQKVAAFSPASSSGFESRCIHFTDDPPHDTAKVQSETNAEQEGDPEDPISEIAQ